MDMEILEMINQYTEKRRFFWRNIRRKHSYD